MEYRVRFVNFVDILSQQIGQIYDRPMIHTDSYRFIPKPPFYAATLLRVFSRQYTNPDGHLGDLRLFLSVVIAIGNIAVQSDPKSE